MCFLPSRHKHPGGFEDYFLSVQAQQKQDVFKAVQKHCVLSLPGPASAIKLFLAYPYYLFALNALSP